MYVVIHYCTSWDFDTQSLNNPAETGGNDGTAIVINEKRCSADVWRCSGPEPK